MVGKKVRIALAAAVISLAVGCFQQAAGCTTILVGKNASADGSVMMAHNEDMGDLSGRLLYQPGKTNEAREISVNYETVPQVSRSYGCWLAGNSIPAAEKDYDGDWVLCGMNEFGVSFSCNLVFTREIKIPAGEGLSRYSIRQLIAERAKTARQAVDMVAELIDTYGQSGHSATYCIADRQEAWLVETTNRHWVAVRVPDDSVRVIANQYTIETQWDLASADLVEYAVAQGWHNPSEGEFNFKYSYINTDRMDQPGNTSREFQGEKMLSGKIGKITIDVLLPVLSLPPIQNDATQSFMVFHLRRNLPPEIGCVMWHGMSSANTSVAAPVYLGANRVPLEYTFAPLESDSKSAWWTFEKLQLRLYPDAWQYSSDYMRTRIEMDKYQAAVFSRSAAMEKKALELLRNGKKAQAKEIISDHTFSELKKALEYARNVNDGK